MGLVIESGFDTRKFGTLDYLVGGTPAYAPASDYTHSDWSGLSYSHGYTQFAPEFEFALQLSTLDGNYSATYSSVTQAYTISHATTPFKLQFYGADSQLLMRILGFTGSQETAQLSHTSDTKPIFLMESDLDCPINYKLDYEAPTNLSGGNENGMIYSVAPTSIPKRADMRIGYIPRADLFKHLATSANPWTWEDFINHHRSGELFFVDGTNWYGVDHAHRLRADGVSFQPSQIAPGYQGEYHLDLRTYIFR